MHVHTQVALGFWILYSKTEVTYIGSMGMHSAGELGFHSLYREEMERSVNEGVWVTVPHTELCEQQVNLWAALRFCVPGTGNLGVPRMSAA